MSSTRRFARLQECHGLFSNRTRNTVNKIILGPSSDSKSYGEICNNTVDHRISGVLVSAVEPQNTTREIKVKRLIEKFENHKHKESFIQDLSQTQKINKFSRESQDVIADLNNTEIFELCENSSKQECPVCNAYWEIGIIYCSCGRNMKSTRSPTEFDKNNRDVTSILGYVIKKNSSRGAKRGPSERQKMCHQAKQMLKKARQGKHRRHPTILSRWYAQESIGWREHHIMLYDRIAVEKHIYIATRAERIQNSKQWILTINAEGPRQPLNQRPDFAQAKREYKRLHDEHLAKTQEEQRTILRSALQSSSFILFPTGLVRVIPRSQPSDRGGIARSQCSLQQCEVAAAAAHTCYFSTNAEEHLVPRSQPGPLDLGRTVPTSRLSAWVVVLIKEKLY